MRCFSLDFLSLFPLFPFVYTLTVRELAKRFGARKVFSQLTFELTTGESLAVTGPNGSGKSTLMLTLLSLYHPTKGSITYADEDGHTIDSSELTALISFVAPYLNLYDQLSAEENLKFFATVGGLNVTGKQVDALLERVGLSGRGNDLVAEFSSGMKQRLKYAVALLKQPAFLFLDEPGSNLDEQGKRLVKEIVEEYRRKTVIIIATNEQEERKLADRQLILGE